MFVKFLQPGTGKSKAAWWVPLTFTDPETGFLKDRQIIWLKPKEAEKHLSDLPDSNTPVIFNINQTGFYRCVTLQRDLSISDNPLNALKFDSESITTNVTGSF